MSWLSDIGDWFKDTGKDIIDWLKEGNEWNHENADKYHFFGSGKDTVGTSSVTDWAKDQIEASTGDAANKTNKEIADQNLEFQRETFDYEKELQKELFQREDTANQRTVNDMRLAGLNPLNMQGTNGAGDVVGVTSPQNQYQESPTRGLDFINTFFNSALQAKANSANNSLAKAQANLLNQQAQNQRIQNQYQSDILQGQIAGLLYDNKNKYLDYSDRHFNQLFNMSMGWTKDMPEWLKESSLRMNFKPITNFGVKNFSLPLEHPDDWYYFPDIDSNFETQDSIGTQYLSDELLTGTMGVFGTLLKKLIGGK